MLKRVHHINFVVHDLEEAVSRYERLFNIKAHSRDTHPERPVKTARFRIGETWIVFVQPLNEESVPGKHLKEHGEGFFLISYEVEDVKTSMEYITDNGGNMLDKKSRAGIANWQVADLDPKTTFDVLHQIVEEKK